MTNEEYIQDYLANRLSEKERSEFEKRLDTDLDFKSEFNSHKDIQAAFEISEAKALKNHLQNLETKTPIKLQNSKIYRTLFLAVASIVIIGFFYTFMQQPSGDKLFDSNFEVYPNTYKPVTRSNAENEDQITFVAYENGNFQTSEIGFANLLKTENNLNIRFYYASSLLNQSKYDDALKEFKKLINKDFDYKAESLWYTALIQTKNENYDAAILNLKQLNNSDSKFKLKERQLLLQKLEK